MTDLPSPRQTFPAFAAENNIGQCSCTPGAHFPGCPFGSRFYVRWADGLVTQGFAEWPAAVAKYRELRAEGQRPDCWGEDHDGAEDGWDGLTDEQREELQEIP